MIQYFKIVEHRTVAIDKPAPGTWVNVLPPLKNEEFTELSQTLQIPLDFLKTPSILMKGAVLKQTRTLNSLS